MNILPVNTIKECILEIASRIRDLRLGKNYSQTELALRAGIKPATYIYFERTGKISFERLVKILMALNRVNDLDRFLKPITVEDLAENLTLNNPALRNLRISPIEIINLYGEKESKPSRKPRKRGRRLRHAN